MLPLAIAIATLLAALWVLLGFNLQARLQFRHLPGPRPDWLLGNLRQLGPLGKSHEVVQQWAAQYGPIFLYWLGQKPVVMLSDPDLVKQVAVKRFMDFHDRSPPQLDIGGSLDNLLVSNGIVFARGKHWLTVRTAMEPVFHSAALESYAPMMNAATGELVDKLGAAAASGDAVCVSELMKAMTLDVIGGTAFGVEFQAQREGRSSKLVETAEAMFKPTGGMPTWGVLLSFALPSLRGLANRLCLWLGAGSVRNTVASRRYLWGALQALLDSARKRGAAAAAGAAGGAAAAAGGAPSGTAKEGRQEQAAAAAEPLDCSLSDISLPPHASATFRRAYREFEGRVPPAASIVSRLKDVVSKQTGQHLSDIDICSQLFTFLVAGYETTSLALSYALYELAKNPGMQRRCQQEVDAFGRDRPIAYADLAQFPYIESAFLEGMRLYPPVTAILALVREPSKPGGGSVTVQTADGGSVGYHIPEGARVAFNIWGIHHETRFYPEPEKYRPERFLPDAPGGPPDQGAFFPFGQGPRKCVGYRFALEEAVLTLARLFQRFDLRLDGERHRGPLDLRSSVTLVPEGGIWLRVHERGREHATWLRGAPRHLSCGAGLYQQQGCRAAALRMRAGAAPPRSLAAICRSRCSRACCALWNLGAHHDTCGVSPAPTRVPIASAAC